MDDRRILPKGAGIAFFIFAGAVSLAAEVTYTLHLGGVNPGIASQISHSVQEAVGIYNTYGSFDKHLHVYYNAGVPTAQANYDGVITFGGSRNTRVALHEMGHTMGIGTYWQYGNLMTGGVWRGYHARKLALEQGSPYNDGIHGDSIHFWPWGLNYDSEDGFMERIRHVRIVAAMRCDMGILAFSREAEHEIVPPGDTAMFAVAAPEADIYRWYREGAALTNGGDIAGADKPTLRIANADLSDEGHYYCVVSGAGETLSSRRVRLLIERPMGRWDFEGNAGDSVGTYDGIVSGSAGYTTGKAGAAIDLDGTNDYVTLPSGVADLEDMTVAAWVHWDGGNPWQRIFDFGTGTSQYVFLTPRSGSNTLRFAIKNGGGEQIVETSQLAAGRWVHVAVTLRQDTATLYIDGRAAAHNSQITIDPKDFSPTSNTIGDSQWGADPFFNGRIDEFRIYGYALSGAEIWNLWGQSADDPPIFAAGPLILPEGSEGAVYTGVTLADYTDDPDDETRIYSKLSGPSWLNVALNGSLSGTPGRDAGGENTFVMRVTDSSGAGDDVTVHLSVFGLPDAHYRFEGSADDDAGGNDGMPGGNPAYTAGFLGQAVNLDGSDDFLTLPAGLANTDDMTIAAWINWDGGSQWQRIFDFGNNTTEYMFLSPRSYSNTLRFALTTTGNGTEQGMETSQLVIGQWVHVAVTLSGDTGRLYVNGELRDIHAAMTIDPAEFNPAHNYVGKSQWPDPLFNGRIDDFRFYGYALSAAEIRALSVPPTFTRDPISNLDGIEMAPYTGPSLATYVDASEVPNGLSFRKVAGPVWLTVASDGTLAGTPNDADVGENVFAVRVENRAGVSDAAQMTIQVANVYSGVRGAEDLAGLAAWWLRQDCTDTPPCDGADLDRDTDVTLTDFSILTHHWLED